MNYKPYIDTTLADENPSEIIKSRKTFAQNNVRNTLTHNYVHVTLGVLTAVSIVAIMSFTNMNHVLYAIIGRLGVFDLVAVQIFLATWFCTSINKMQNSTAKMAFYSYFVLAGITLSTLFCAVSIEAIIVALIIAVILCFGVKWLVNS